MHNWHIIQSNDYDALKKIYQTRTSEFIGFVYAVEWNDYVKIGSTNNPERRVRQFTQHQKYGDVKLGRIAISPACTNYQEIEKTLHKENKYARVEGTELFSLFLEDMLRELPQLNYKDEPKQKEAEINAFTKSAKQFVLSGPIQLNDALEDKIEQTVDECPEELLLWLCRRYNKILKLRSSLIRLLELDEITVDDFINHHPETKHLFSRAERGDD